MQWTGLVAPVAAAFMAVVIIMVSGACIRAVETFKRVYGEDPAESQIDERRT